MALKGNQETLHQAVIDYVDQNLDNDFADVPARRHQGTDKGHGREEVRSYIHMPVPETLRGAELWKGMKSIGLATLVCTRNGQETGETRYYISSLPVGVKRFARAVRSHWSIENSCHWSLDMTFREDESRIREPQIRENFAWLNRFTLSLLKQHPGKDSIAMKRRACGWSDNFLLEILTGTTLELQLTLPKEVGMQAGKPFEVVAEGFSRKTVWATRFEPRSFQSTGLAQHSHRQRFRAPAPRRESPGRWGPCPSRPHPANKARS